MLGVAEGDAYLGSDPEAQKSALTVLINCVCGPQEKVSFFQLLVRTMI